jgi:hypothetical protein
MEIKRNVKRLRYSNATAAGKRIFSVHGQSLLDFLRPQQVCLLRFYM